VLETRGRGKLPPLVVLHGFSSAGVHFHPILTSLRKRSRRIVAPDLLAHGFSDVPKRPVTIAQMEKALIETLDSVLDEPAVLFGLSMGGAAALRYTLARPERVRGLMLCSPGGAAMQPDELDRLRQSFKIDRHADALAFVDRVFARRTMLRQAYAWGLRKSFDRPVMQSLLASLRTEDLFQPGELASLRLPIRLVWGACDRVLPKASREFFRKNLPAHTLIDEPKSFGHSPFLDDPEGLARRIEAFLLELSRPSLAKTCRDEAISEPPSPSLRRAS
jgi:pimeloyl-ACP methyl ester carboxylesterase